MSDQKNRKLVILTGAGFSKTFGFPLAKDMREMLYNELNTKTKIFTDEFYKHKNFEDIFTELQNSHSPDFPAFKEEIIKIFPTSISHYSHIEPSTILSNFIKFIIENYLDFNDVKYIDIFTLNVDLL